MNSCLMLIASLIANSVTTDASLHRSPSLRRMASHGRERPHEMLNGGASNLEHETSFQEVNETPKEPAVKRRVHRGVDYELSRPEDRVDQSEEYLLKSLPRMPVYGPSKADVEYVINIKPQEAWHQAIRPDRNNMGHNLVMPIEHFSGDETFEEAFVALQEKFEEARDKAEKWKTRTDGMAPYMKRSDKPGRWLTRDRETFDTNNYPDAVQLQYAHREKKEEVERAIKKAIYKYEVEPSLSGGIRRPLWAYQQALDTLKDYIQLVNTFILQRAHYANQVHQYNNLPGQLHLKEDVRSKAVDFNDSRLFEWNNRVDEMIAKLRNDEIIKEEEDVKDLHRKPEPSDFTILARKRLPYDWNLVPEKIDLKFEFE